MKNFLYSDAEFTFYSFQLERFFKGVVIFSVKTLTFLILKDLSKIFDQEFSVKILTFLILKIFQKFLIRDSALKFWLSWSWKIFQKFLTRDSALKFWLSTIRKGVFGIFLWWRWNLIFFLHFKRCIPVK